jgi:hypothetical protein
MPARRICDPVMNARIQEHHRARVLTKCLATFIARAFGADDGKADEGQVDEWSAR